MALVITGFDENNNPVWGDDGTGNTEADQTDNNTNTNTTDFVTEITNNAKPGEHGYGWKYYSDGTAISPTGVYYYQGQAAYDPNKSTLNDLVSQLAKGSLTPGSVAKYISQNPGQAAGIIGGLANLNNQPNYNRVGYQGSIPQYTAVRQSVPLTNDPTRRPGSSGQQYFTDVQYVPKTDTGAISAAKDTAIQQAEQLVAKNAANPVREKAMAGGGLADLSNYFSKGNLDVQKVKSALAGMDQVSSDVGSSAGSDDLSQLLSLLASAKGATSASQEPRPIDAPETTQGSTPAPTQTQGTTPEPKTLDTFPVARQPEPEVPQAKFADDELGLSKAAWKYIRDSQDTQKMAPDLGNWGVDKKDHIYYGGWYPGPSDRRNVTHYSDIPNEVFEKYVASRAKHDFNAANELLNPYAHWNMTEEDEMRLQHPDEYWALHGPKEIQAAQGGLMGLARGRYLQGATDGMADKLPASIDGREPAKLSHGEFVVPADVVSHLGNGNSDAGAKKLYSMMDKIRMARTGTKKQGKQINPDKFMPGGAVGYASGGGIKGFAGETGSFVNTGTGTSSSTPYESNLSTWAGPYVTDMLGKGQALSNMPYQAYQGPLTAGAAGLQETAFKTAKDLAIPDALKNATTSAGDISSQMQKLTGTKFDADTFGAKEAQAYMNPYLQASLDPQIAEARRQAQITNMQNMAKLTQAGAYGGGRQAIMQSEADRNLASNLANITGQGYNTAYQQAMAQFNADQARKQAAQQFGANYGLQALQGALSGAQAQGSLGAQQSQIGLQNLAQQAALGQVQRGIEAEGLAADKAQFEEARDYPYKMLQFQQSLLSGLPLQTQAPVTPVNTGLQNFSQAYTTISKLLDTLKLT